MTHSIQIIKIDQLDPRLGRHVEHDSRSLNYAVEPAEAGAIKSVSWNSAIGTLNQGQVGSCTGNAATKVMTYGPLWNGRIMQLLNQDLNYDEAWAMGVYSDAEVIDGDGPYPPNDNGSSGLSVAKVLKNRGLIAGYQHCLSLSAVQTAMQTSAVITGTSWYEGMFNPTDEGELQISGQIAGGHEYVLDKLDMENQRIWMHNSWGDSWGKGGGAWMSFDTYSRLLAMKGDATVFTPISVPTPTPAPDDNVDDEFKAAADTWLGERHASAVNKALVNPLQAYMKKHFG